MKIFLWWIDLCVFILCVSSCCNYSLREVYHAAGNNKLELEEVVNQSKKKGRLEYQSAIFLLENISPHYSKTSAAVDSFVSSLSRLGITKPDINTIDSVWSSLKSIDSTHYLFDVREISSSFLLHTIDQAVERWRTSQWKEEITEELFLNYVLPYRFANEKLPIDSWRDTLYSRYHFLIDTITDLKRAYYSVYKHVVKEFKLQDLGEIDYLLNSMDVNKIKCGRCLQQCIFVASIMRALGIPVAIDGVYRWGNYSSTGHSWVALVTKEGTYTINNGDSVAKKYNTIHSSLFRIKRPQEDYPMPLDFKKRPSIIRRMMYVSQDNEYDDPHSNWKTRAYFSASTSLNVSSEYGLRGNYKGKLYGSGYGYLCCFETGKDWIPVATAKSKRGLCQFEYLTDSVVYLFAKYKHGHLVALDYPFYLVNGHVHYIKADADRKVCVRLTRKYPFVATMIRPWRQSLGSMILASNDSTFQTTDTLFLIDKTPLYKNVIKTSNASCYRYLKYASRSNRKGSLTELKVFSGDSLVYGRIFSQGVLDAEKYFDGQTMIGPQNVSPGFQIGLDFSRSIPIDSVVFYLKNDGNFIDIGDEYELLFYDNHQWNSVGMQVARTEELLFCDVPFGALLLLKDHSKGTEERIFTYEDEKQNWW